MKKSTIFLNKYWPWIIFAIALILRLLLLYRFNFRLGWEKDGFPGSDAREYNVLAMNILMGRGFGDYLFGFKYQSFVSPVYSLFLAFIYSFFGHTYIAVKIVQLILSSLNAAVIYAIGKRLFNRQIGIIAGLILACYLPYMWYVSCLMRETFFIFIFACTYLSMLKAMDESSIKHSVLAGFLIGATVLTRPGGLILLPIFTVWCLTKRDLKKMLIISLFVFLTLSPWLARSMIVHNGGIILETSGARHFWTGANPEYRGDFYERSAWHKSLWDRPFDSEIERYKRLNREGIKFIKQNPKRYFKYFQKRIKDLWYIKGLKEIRFDLNGTEIWLIYLTVWLGAIGALHSVFLSRRSLSLLAIILLYTLGAGFYGGLTRYRMPVEQFLIILAAYTIYCISQIHHLDWRNMKIRDSRYYSSVFHRPFHKFLTVCGFILLLTFSVRLCIAYWGPEEKIVALNINKKEIQPALKNHNLLEKWRKQVPQNISYKDVFLDQAENNGYINKYNDYIVIWKGRMSYIAKDENGNIRNFTFVLNPSPHSFGEEKIGLYPIHGIQIKASEFQEGDIVLVIAKIRTTGQPLLDPYVEFYEILKKSSF